MTTETLTTYDGLRLHVTVHGPADAPVTVLLSHCWTADETDWHYQVADLLSRYGHRIRLITWDHRGHGRSDRPGGRLHDPQPRARPRCRRRRVRARRPAGARRALRGRDDDHGAPRGVLARRAARIAGLLMVSTSGADLHTVTLGLPEVGPILRDRLPFVLASRARMLSLSRRQRFPLIERADRAAVLPRADRRDRATSATWSTS